MKKAVSFESIYLSISEKASPSMNEIAGLREARARILFMRVSGYHRDETPLPFSPTFIRLAPGASIPPRNVLFLKTTWNAWSTSDRGLLSSSRITFSLEIWKSAILLLSCFRCGLRRHFHTALTSGSNSPSTTLSTSPSESTPKGTLPPPVKGSTSFLTMPGWR